MYLTKEEEAILAGELGEAAQKAMKVVVAVGEALGAERLVKVEHAHVSGVSYFNIGDHGLELIEDLLGEGARFSVFTTANPHAVITGYGDRNFSPEVVGKQMRIVNALRSMGVKSFTCAPYYIRRPSPGEHLAWAESSAVLYANSLLGAMTNREPGVVALMAGIIGRTYLGEAHKGLPESVDLLIEVERPGDVSEAGALGLLAGEAAGSKIAMIRGLEGLPEAYLKEFLAAFAVKSPVHLTILNGITPEHHRVDASRAERLKFSRHEIADLYSEVESCGSPLYLLGCPHLSTDEVMEILDVLGGAAGAQPGEVWLTSGDYVNPGKISPAASDKVRVIPGACVVTTRLDLLGVDCVITDSAKALAYLPKLAGVKAVLMSRSRLLKVLSGGRGPP